MNKFIDRLKKSFGPGVITGIADDDPSGIITYSQTGAMFGLGQLWLALYAFPFMVAIQEMCGRIGMTTGKGLAALIRSHYSRPVLYIAVILLLLANTINIGADLGAMAAVSGLVFPISFGVALIGITLFCVITTVYIPYATYVKILKWLGLSVVAYVIAALFVHHAWGEIFKALLVPHFNFDKAFLLNMTAMLGTTISPYLFFWQAGEEIEEEVASNKLRFFGRGTPKVSSTDLNQMRSDTFVGMLVSNIITFFIIITASSTLYGHGDVSTLTASTIASALEPVAGSFATILFTLGILGTGLLAIPVLAGSAGYALAESVKASEGLGKTFFQAKYFYAVIVISMLAGALINILGIDPMAMLYYSAAANGILAAPLMIIILLIANNKKILGNNTNSLASNIFGWAITIIMGIIALCTVVAFFP
jgi:NRAMP (natural resistance-associated macrophage protein)-like metal ion transporter